MSIEFSNNWESAAKRLAEVMSPIYNERETVLEGISNLRGSFNFKRNFKNELHSDTSDGGSLCITWDGSRDLRLYKLTDHEHPGYHIEIHSTEHFLVYLDKKGQIEKFVDVDVVGMNRDHVSGYHGNYEREINLKNPDQLIGAFDTISRLQKYVDAFAILHK